MDQPAHCPVVLFGPRDLDWNRALRRKLRDQGVRVAGTASIHHLLESLDRDAPEIVVLDEDLVGPGAGTLAAMIRERSPGTRIILLLPEDSRPTEEVRRAFAPHHCAVKPVPDEALWRLVASVLGARSGARRRPLVVCVDDDKLYLKGLSRMIGRRGYRVITYEDPEQALADLPLMKPDLLLLDVLMPGMSGLQLSREIREEYGAGLPIVLLSARDADLDIARGYQNGACHYLTKPCAPEAVLNVVDYLVGDLSAPEREGLKARL